MLRSCMWMKRDPCQGESIGSGRYTPSETFFVDSKESRHESPDRSFDGGDSEE